MPTVTQREHNSDDTVIPVREIQIAPQSEGKGRTFRATFLAAVEADLLWGGGETVTDNTRPIWAMFAGSDNELRAFMANLASGRKATFLAKRQGYRRKADCLEILKSYGYRMTWQREEEGSIATIFLPELFQIDPGMVDPKGATFVMLPTQAWYEQQRMDVDTVWPLIQHARRCGYKDQTEAELANWALLSFLFATYLDRRTRCPLVADGRFYFQLMLSCLKHKLATFSTVPDRSYYDTEFGQHASLRYHELNTTAVNLLPGLAFKADHETLEKLLAHEVEQFFAVTKGL